MALLDELYNDPYGTMYQDAPSIDPLSQLGKSIARGVPQALTGFVDLAALPFTLSGLLKPEQAVGSTEYLTAKGLLPTKQTGLLNESAELLSSILTPAGAAKTVSNLARKPAQVLDQPNLLGVTDEQKAFITKEKDGILEVEPTIKPQFSQQVFGQNAAEGIFPSTAIATRGAGQATYGINESEANRQIQSLLRNPETNRAFQVANQISQNNLGVPYNTNIDIESSLAKQSGIARTYQIASEMPDKYPKQQVFEGYLNNPEYSAVINQLGIKNADELLEASYKQLELETEQQFKALPVKMSFHDGSMNYTDSGEMLRDIIGHNHLTVFRGGDKHDFLNKIDPDTGLTSNEKFRATHDYYGHAIKGNGFGAKGEETAFASHQQMYSPLARIAMTAETRGQNSFVNYSPVNAELYSAMENVRKAQYEAKLAGNMDDFNEAAEILRQLGGDWQYAKQASILLPVEFTSPAFKGGMPNYLMGAVEPKFGVEQTLSHFGKAPDIAELDPTKYSTGIRGEELRRLQETVNPVVPRSYAYRGAIDEVRPEAGLGAYGYQTNVSGLYDIAQDPENLGLLSTVRNTTSYLSPYNKGLLDAPQQLTDLERLTREYGYRGLLDPTKAILFNPTPVRRVR